MMRSALNVILALALLVLGFYSYTRIQDLERMLAAANHFNQEEGDPGELKKELASVRADNARLKSQASEIYKLRGEMTVLKKEKEEALARTATAPANSSAFVTSWVERGNQLRNLQSTMPDKFIPEIQLLSEMDWLDVARDADLSSDDGIRSALSRLREKGKNKFIDGARKAIVAYSKAHDSSLPDNMQQLKDYFPEPMDDAVLARYEMIEKGKLTNKNATLVRETAPPVDNEFETLHEFGITSGSTANANMVAEEVMRASKKFFDSNQGHWPENPNQINSLLTFPIQENKVAKYLKIAAEQRAQ
jgi:hypothetical protein